MLLTYNNNNMNNYKGMVMFDMKIQILHTFIEKIPGKCKYLHSAYFVLQLLSKICSLRISKVSYHILTCLILHSIN